MYYDYDMKKKEPNPYEGVVTLFALWAGVASEEQAYRVV
jgi:neutral trehalase